jgi:predicted translin family RNA/ssDNA-binding protein
MRKHEETWQVPIFLNEPLFLGVMFDETEFEEIKKRFEAFDEKRERIIKESRDILKLSKQAIYSVQRDDVKKAQGQLADAERIKAVLEKEIAAETELRTGGFCDAMAEYVEAKTLLGFVQTGMIPSMKSLGVHAEDYLLGLSDLTGELGRRAVIAATKKDKAQVRAIHDAMEFLYGQFVKFDFRNGELRRKYDAMKYNLQKVERILYELTLANASQEE